jgi:hypothetical protein
MTVVLIEEHGANASTDSLCSEGALVQEVSKRTSTKRERFIENPYRS